MVKHPSAVHPKMFQDTFLASDLLSRAGRALLFADWPRSLLDMPPSSCFRPAPSLEWPDVKLKTYFMRITWHMCKPNFKREDHFFVFFLCVCFFFVFVFGGLGGFGVCGFGGFFGFGGFCGFGCSFWLLLLSIDLLFYLSFYLSFFLSFYLASYLSIKLSSYQAIYRSSYLAI